MERSRPVPRWVAAVIVVALLAGVGAFLWWLVTGRSLGGNSEVIITAPVGKAGRTKPALPPDQARFYEATRAGDVGAMRKLIEKDRTLVRRADQSSGDCSALHYAAWEGQVAAIHLLVDAGAELNVREKDYNGTPLSWAIVNGRPAAAAALIARGAKLSDDLLDTARAGKAGRFQSFARGTPDDYAAIEAALLKAGVKDRAPARDAFEALLRGDDVPEARLRAVGATRLVAGELSGWVVGGRADKTEDGGVRLTDDVDRSGLVLDEVWTAPVTIALRAKTDGQNLRVYFGRGQLIFNWEVNEDELRLHDPLTGKPQGIGGRGRITPREWHEIRWEIRKDASQVFVDGGERVILPAPSAGLKGRIGVGAALGSEVTVRAVKVERGTE